MLLLRAARSRPVTAGGGGASAHVTRSPVISLENQFSMTDSGSGSSSLMSCDSWGNFD